MNKMMMLGAILLLTFVAAESASKPKSQVIYKEEADGGWHVWIFGPNCPHDMKLVAVSPKDPAEPIELKCQWEGK